MNTELWPGDEELLEEIEGEELEQAWGVFSESLIEFYKRKIGDN